MTTAVRRRPVLAVGIVIGLVFGAVGLIGGDPSWGVALSAAIVAGVIAAARRRFETLEIL